jgi:hypothetical protein
VWHNIHTIYLECDFWHTVTICPSMEISCLILYPDRNNLLRCDISFLCDIIWNVTFYLLWLFVHPWKISCLIIYLDRNNLLLCDISSLCDIIWNVTFYLLWQFVYPWKISCLILYLDGNNFLLCDISSLCNIIYNEQWTISYLSQSSMGWWWSMFGECGS